MVRLTQRTAVVLLAAAAAACASVQSTASNPDVPAAERSRAGQQHPQILAQFGGAYDGPQAGYVARVGERIAAAAGVPGQCTFTVVNTDVVNAFAVPGCYIYVTRGLLGIMNSEAELASVLGHEVGHVVADHSDRRRNAATLSGLGAILLGVVTESPDLARAAGQSAQLYTLNYSREQEYESDDLGLRYLLEAGYDPYALADMLEALQDHDRLEAQTRGRDANAIPEWARTHPLTEQRVSRALAQAGRTGVAPGALPEQEEAFLAALDGMLYGDDPAQGFINGSTFAHPELRLAFEAPQGYVLTNSSSAVLIEGPGNVRAQFSGGRLAGGLEAYATNVLRQLLGETPAQVGAARRDTVNGLPAVLIPARAQTNGGVADVAVAAYQFDEDSAYHFVSVAPAGAGSSLTSLYNSLRRLPASEASALRPRRLEVRTVQAGDTVAGLASRMAFETGKLERFLMLNDLEADQPLARGDRVKLVVWR
jgi:predicted Zn-dependent protease